MIILGIDPGLSITGYSILRNHKNSVEMIDFGILKMSSKKTIPPFKFFSKKHKWL